MIKKTDTYWKKVIKDFNDVDNKLLSLQKTVIINLNKK